MSGDLDTQGQQTSSTPVEGGVMILNGAVPRDHPDHIVYRGLSNKEHGEQAKWRKRNEEQRASADRAHLRLERNRMLANTDWVELPSAKARLTEAQMIDALAYRQQLRDLPIDDLPALPDPPAILGQATVL